VTPAEAAWDRDDRWEVSVSIPAALLKYEEKFIFVLLVGKPAAAGAIERRSEETQRAIRETTMNGQTSDDRVAAPGAAETEETRSVLPRIDPASVSRPRFAWADVPRYFRDPLGYLSRVRREKGIFARLPLGPVTPFLISDPALIEHVLVTDNKSYKKDLFIQMLAEEAVGRGLLTSEGDFWRRQRRLAQPAFHRERIAGYATTMIRCAEAYADTLALGQERALHRDLMELTLHIVAQALFSDDENIPTQEVGAALDVLMERYADNLLLAFPVLRRLPLPINRRFDRAMKRLDDIMLSLIARRRERGGGHSDLLSMLLRAQDEDGSRMTDRQLRDEVITLFTAGHETTALALSYAFFLLSQHPQVAATLQAELNAVLGPGPLLRLPSFADFPSLRYCEAVVLETLRLYPPAWIIGREAATDTTLSGVAIPRGAQIWMSQWVVHRDESLFAHADLFRPERWLDGLQKRLPRFAYFPFGGGPRLCIGNSFAMVEATLVLATIARRYHLRVLTPPPLSLLPSITLRPRDGFLARVEAAVSTVAKGA
jgi:cytochrome P450